MSRKALGLIETVGLAAAIEAADTCMKAANVELVGYELTKGYGMVTIKIKGDVSAVKAAIESAKVSAAAVNTVYATLVIPRPADKLDIMIESRDVIGLKSKFKEEKKIIEIVEEKIEKQNGQKLVEEKSVIQEKSILEEEPIIVEEITQEGKDEATDEGLCNLCYDPECSRKKGMTKKLCMHYKDSEGDKK